MNILPFLLVLSISPLLPSLEFFLPFCLSPSVPPSLPLSSLFPHCPLFHYCSLSLLLPLLFSHPPFFPPVFTSLYRLLSILLFYLTLISLSPSLSLFLHNSLPALPLPLLSMCFPHSVASPPSPYPLWFSPSLTPLPPSLPQHAAWKDSLRYGRHRFYLPQSFI